MVPTILVDELVAVLKDALANCDLATSTGVNRAPSVIPGWLLPQPSDPHADLPYVLVKFTGHDDTARGESEARVNIYVSTYSESSEGWRDVANLIELIRQALLKKRSVAKKFMLVLPMKSMIPTEEQPYPKWVGWLETRWSIAQPVEEVIIDGESY